MKTPTSLSWDLFVLETLQTGGKKMLLAPENLRDEHKASQWRADGAQGNHNIVSTRNYLYGAWFDSLGNLLILTNCKYFRRLHTSFCDRVRNSSMLILLFALNQLLLKLSYKGEHNSSLAWQEQKEVPRPNGLNCFCSQPLLVYELTSHVGQMSHLCRQSCLHWGEGAHITQGGSGPSEHRFVIHFCVNKKWKLAKKHPVYSISQFASDHGAGQEVGSWVQKRNCCSKLRLNRNSSTNEN